MTIKRNKQFEKSILADIRNNPDDLFPREVYSDYLQELGDPRGEFIAVQLALGRLGSPDRLTELKMRESRLTEERLFEFMMADFNDIYRDHYNFYIRNEIIKALRYRNGFLHYMDLGNNYEILLDYPVFLTVREVSLEFPRDFRAEGCFMNVRKVWDSFNRNQTVLVLDKNGWFVSEEGTGPFNL